LVIIAGGSQYILNLVPVVVVDDDEVMEELAVFVL